MNKAQKQVALDNLTEVFSNNNFFYIADTSGLSVQKINKLRRICFEKGIKLQVAKNTLVKKALVAAGNYNESLDVVLTGPTALFFSETSSLPAKVIKEFRKENDKPILKGAYIDSAIFIGDNQLDVLASLKSKEELVGEIIGLLQSPAKNVISALQSGGNKLAGIVKTLQERN